MTITRSIVLALALAGPAVPALAQDYNAAIKARQGQFRLMALNLGVIGDMAQGKADWNADMAAAAAANLVTVSSLNQMPMWPEGSDEIGAEGTRAKAEIWDNIGDLQAKWAAFGEAATALETAVAAGPDGLGPAVGGVAGTCKACHEAYRAPSS